jgi:hypothetical protein
MDGTVDYYDDGVSFLLNTVLGGSSTIKSACEIRQ